MSEWGWDMGGRVYTDATAALGIAKRKGAGKLRHINVNALWIEDVQDREGAEFMKILGTENPADLMTKHLIRDKVDKCMNTIHQIRLDGRAASGLTLQGAPGQ